MVENKALTQVPYFIRQQSPTGLSSREDIDLRNTIKSEIARSNMSLRVLTAKSTGYPYVKARTVKNSKRWFIVFYAWDEATSTLKRKKIESNINTITELKTREEYCRSICIDINQKLEAGLFFVDEKENKPIKRSEIITVEKAFTYVIDMKRKYCRKKTILAYERAKNYFVQWLELKRKALVLPGDITKQDVAFFRDWLLQKKPLNSRSINNIISFLRTLFNDAKERGWLKENPAEGIKKIIEQEHERFYSFNDEQLQKVKNHLSTANPYLWIYAQTIFYTFIRSGDELRTLKVRDIDLKKKQITVRGMPSKTRSKRIVDILEPLYEILLQMELHKYPAEYYVFTKLKAPGPVPFTEKAMYTAFSRELKKLNIPESYSIYSMKHTGVEQHYLAGMDIKYIQAQCGHAKLETTDMYLKRLGLNRRRNEQNMYCKL